jgi:signal transduction histidine kinase
VTLFTVTMWTGWPAWRLRVRSLVPLAILDFAVIAPQPGRIGWPGGVCLAAVSVGWLAMSLASRPRFATVFAPVVLAVAGSALSAIEAPGTAFAFPAVACLNSAARWPLRWSAPFALVVGGGLAGAEALAGRGGAPILIGPGVCLGGLLVGLIRRQNEALAEETRLAREGQSRSAALDERARIAREIHDVLAHSLAALTVQLETADALLEGGRAEQARHSVVRAGQLAREGLAETRRAIGALRGETLPLPELLADLTGGYRADFGAAATVRVDGQPREVNPDIALALYRTAQEAMTNIRKHAPGAGVEMVLRYEPELVTLSVTNAAAPDGARRPLAATGGGYGLTGLRERAELAGGTFAAGPAEKGEPGGSGGTGWRVDVRIPA